MMIVTFATTTSIIAVMVAVALTAMTSSRGVTIFITALAVIIAIAATLASVSFSNPNTSNTYQLMMALLAALAPITTAVLATVGPNFIINILANRPSSESRPLVF